MGERCTGHCCRELSIPYRYADLSRAFVADKLGEGSFWSTYGNLAGVPHDIGTIFPMLIPNNDGTDEHKESYRCRHFDGISCAIYETKPRMCSEYPYGRKCSQADCTWDEARTVGAGARPLLGAP